MGVMWPVDSVIYWTIFFFFFFFPIRTMCDESANGVSFGTRLCSSRLYPSWSVVIVIAKGTWLRRVDHSINDTYRVVFTAG